MAEIDIVTTTIAAGQTTTPEIDIGNKSLVGIQFTANWTPAATITFQATIDGGATFGPVITLAGGTAAPLISASIGAGQSYLALDPTILRGMNAFKIVANPAQTNLVTLSLITRLAI
jgi:hypothetical protein